MSFEPLKLLDPRAFGLLVKQWAKDPTSRPRTLAEFKVATQGILGIPDRIVKDPIYPEWTTDNLVIRLPAIELIEQSEQELDRNPGKYPLDPFYEELVDGTITGREGLYRRIGDYTRSQCG